jgi:hypothetical protein
MMRIIQLDRASVYMKSEVQGGVKEWGAFRICTRSSASRAIWSFLQKLRCIMASN